MEELAALLGPFDMQGRVQDVTRLEDEVAPRCCLHTRSWSRLIRIPDGDEEEAEVSISDSLASQL